eukprot:gene11707-11852_t
MSDHDHETFESADAGASHTYPQQAGTIRKNGFLVCKGRPCKTGKHGHAKCNFVAIDIFTGKKYEEMTPSSHNMDVPNISRTEYTLVDINEEGFVTLMMENGDTREDLTLPTGTEEADKLAAQLKADFADGKELVVSVLKAMGEEMINSVKCRKCHAVEAAVRVVDWAGAWGPHADPGVVLSRLQQWGVPEVGRVQEDLEQLHPVAVAAFTIL